MSDERFEIDLAGDGTFGPALEVEEWRGTTCNGVETSLEVGVNALIEDADVWALKRATLPLRCRVTVPRGEYCGPFWPVAGGARSEGGQWRLRMTFEAATVRPGSEQAEAFDAVMGRLGLVEAK